MIGITQRKPYDPREINCYRVLFVCTGGMLRSATAAHHFAKTRDWNCRAAGCAHDLAVMPVCDTTCRWADAIFCMEQGHYDHIVGALPEVKDKTKCLNIHDGYTYMQPELIELLEKAIGP